jgi:inosine triphosphate pyrophosphatase
MMAKLPIFITGNQSKADYLSRQLGVVIEHKKLELEELQSTDLHVIVEHKLRQSYEICKAPVLVEDVSLVFCALGELPGPYIKWFIEIAGVDACCKMLNGFEDRSAIIRCTFGYFDGQEIRFFDSEMPGAIAAEPRGKNGFGFDRIFINDGYNITRSEMTQAENERTYAENMKPFKQVREFIQSF